MLERVHWDVWLMFYIFAERICDSQVFDCVLSAISFVFISNMVTVQLHCSWSAGYAVNNKEPASLKSINIIFLEPC